MVSSSETRLLIKENNNTKSTLNVKPVPQHFKRWLASLCKYISSNKNITFKYIEIIFTRITVCWAIVSFMANVVQLKQYKLLYGKNSLPTSPYWCVLIFVAVLSCSVSVIYLKYFLLVWKEDLIWLLFNRQVRWSLQALECFWNLLWTDGNW